MVATASRGRPIALGVMVIISLVALLIYILWSGPSSLDQDAKTIIQAALDNDPDTVFLYVFEFQKDAAGVSKERFAQMWQALIHPRVKGIAAVGVIQAEVFRGDHQAQGWTTVRLPSGATFELPVAPWATGDRGGIPMFHFLRIAWDVEYVHAKGLPLSAKTSLEARLQGIAKDRVVLESLGFLGWPPEEPGGKVVPWDDTVKHWQKRLAEITESDQHSSRQD